MFGGGKLKKQIAELESRCEWQSAQLAAARKPDGDLRNRFLREERLRREAERLAAERDGRIRILEAEVLRLKARDAEGDALRAELRRGAVLLRWERRKVRHLEQKLCVRKGKEDYFGLATPSSLRLSKPKATPDNKARKGGAVDKHKGHGRAGFLHAEADEVVALDTPPAPCGCGCPGWDAGKTTPHCVTERVPARNVKRIYMKTEFTCPNCGQRTTPPTPGVVPGGLFANSIAAHLLSEHYLHGLAAGSICKREGIGEGTFFQIAARTAKLLKPTYEELLKLLRFCARVHGDETGWRCDGDRAYAWTFANDKLVVFLFRDTRAGTVPLQIFGNGRLEIILVTDRYAGYNALNVYRQYCYVHLLRDLAKLETEFPAEQEVAAFAMPMKESLKAAIAMHGSKLPPTEYAAAANAIKDGINAMAWQEANHPGIQKFQNIFRLHADCCFQWVRSPDIPAENNFAERILRPIAITRKISFGSQSAKGMETREVLMTFLHTVKMNGRAPCRVLEEAMNILAQNRNADLLPLLGIQRAPAIPATD